MLNRYDINIYLNIVNCIGAIGIYYIISNVVVNILILISGLSRFGKFGRLQKIMKFVLQYLVATVQYMYLTFDKQSRLGITEVDSQSLVV